MILLQRVVLYHRRRSNSYTFAQNIAVAHTPFAPHPTTRSTCSTRPAKPNPENTVNPVKTNRKRPGSTTRHAIDGRRLAWTLIIPPANLPSVLYPAAAVRIRYVTFHRDILYVKGAPLLWSGLGAEHRQGIASSGVCMKLTKRSIVRNKLIE